MDSQIVDPTKETYWNENISVFKDATAFHTSNWANILKQTYHYNPVYIIQKKNDQFISVLPLFDVRSPITGARGVSIPFTDLCPVLSTDSASLRELFDKAIQLGIKYKWGKIQFRGSDHIFNDMDAKLCRSCFIP